MRIAFCSAEVSPFAKVGGLADVAGSLPRALTEHGHEVTVFMPAYGMVIDDPRYGAKLVCDDLIVRVNPYRLLRARIWEVRWHGVRHWLIDGDGVFARVRRSEEVYTMHRDDYLFFSRAVMAACEHLDWFPEVVSAHDWHMGFVPVVVRQGEAEEWEHIGTTFTIHNLAYQGEFGFDTLEAAGVDGSLYTMHQLETYGSVNFLKAGCAFANVVNTVSPNYAEEIQTPEFGCRLEGLMRHLADDGRLRGILNGIDTEEHDPETDPRIPHHYSLADLAGKGRCRGALADELGLELDEQTPVLSVISRLSNQKGFDLMTEAAERFLALGAAWVVLGQGDPVAAARLRELEAAHPGRVRFVERFDTDLAQRIYAGSDIFLMPSSFEPCGLGQLFAMRYGTVPVVRRTGGLADTVTEGTNGFVFERRDTEEFLAAVTRAVKAFRKPTTWKKLVLAGMKGSYCWNGSSDAYGRMFRDANRLQVAVAQGDQDVAS